MRILPVIDLRGGLVVRGVGGRRAEYAPVQSRITPDARPASVAQTFAGLGLDEVYVADLDAIAGAEPAWAAYREMAACCDRGRLRLWVDGGVADLGRAEAFARFVSETRAVDRIVVGLESLADSALLPGLGQIVGPERLVFSLDLKRGQPIVRAPGWQGMTPLAIAQEVFNAGLRRMIVLDLARVGEGRGPGTEAICRALRAAAPESQLFAGGGVTGLEDLRSLAAAGCDGALVASALHDGRLDRAKIEAAASW